jgi:2-polyprenyl-3-methyl-5-hydroxy-6-metoxy-1,4-benzoquinol methylase
MKLPARDALVEPDHVFLYDHDVHELHSSACGDSTRLMYVTRFAQTLRAVDRWASGRGVLDIGCAQGNFTLALAERGYSVVAVDLRPTFLRYARLKYEMGHVRWVAASLETLPFPARAFDVVLLTEVIEHVAYPEIILRAVARTLRPNGILVLTTPNGARLHTGLPTLKGLQDRETLALRQFEPDADGHLFLLSPEELRTLVEDSGLGVVSHQLFCSPWISGRLKGRYVSRLLPVRARTVLDRLILKVPVISRLLAEGQLLVASSRPSVREVV